VTTQGMKESEMAEIARFIGRVVKTMREPNFDEIAADVRAQVAASVRSSRLIRN